MGIRACVVAALFAGGVGLAGLRADEVVVVVPPAEVRVSVDTTVIQRDGDTLRLLNTTVKGADGKAVSHLDVGIKLSLDTEGKLRAEVESRPTTLVGVDALVAGVYWEAKGAYELKGPAIDVDMRPSWTIKGPGFSGTLVSGPVKGHPQLVDAKGTETLPEAGVYGVVAHDRAFGGIANTTRTLVNVRQVADTLVVTGYWLEGSKWSQTGVAVLKAKKGEVEVEKSKE